jgi:MATE family multidrug resistance protein
MTDLAIARLGTVGGLLRLALPFAAGAGLGYAMHFINRLFLSWYSTEALAAALPAGFLAWTVQALFICAAGYVGTFAGTHAAANEPEEAGAMLWPMLVLCAAATVLSLGCIPLRHLIVLVYGTEPAVALPMAELFAWYLAETGLIALISGAGGFFAGIGRPVLVVIMAGAGCVLSIVLNYWLILGGLGIPALGITGAGIATLATSLIVAAVWIVLLFAPRVRREFGTWRMRNLDSARLWRFAWNALPRGACEVLEMVGFMMFNGAVARLGTEALAAHNLVFSLYLLVMVPFIGLFNGLTVAVGQCLGAGRVDLAWRTAGLGWKLLLVVMLPCGMLFVLVPGLVLAPFRSGDDAVWTRLMALAAPLMAFAAVAMVADGLQFCFRCAVQGAGDTRWPFVVLTASAVLLCGLPAAGIAMLVAAGNWPSWAPAPLTACWTVFLTYIWIVAGICWLRWRFGPWTRMSVRG